MRRMIAYLHVMTFRLFGTGGALRANLWFRCSSGVVYALLFGKLISRYQYPRSKWRWWSRLLVLFIAVSSWGKQKSINL